MVEGSLARLDKLGCASHIMSHWQGTVQRCCTTVQIPSSITVASSRAAVAFLSDGSNQEAGFEMTWDQGIFCDPLAHLFSPTGTFTDGTPVGQRYRCA